MHPMSVMEVLGSEHYYALIDRVEQVMHPTSEFSPPKNEFFVLVSSCGFCTLVVIVVSSGS